MLIDKLERLVDAFEAHGHPVRANLAPGATAIELDDLADRRGFELPDDFRTLYGWHNGHIEQEGAPVLKFRDNPFCEIGNASAQLTLDIYEDVRAENREVEWPLDLTACLPIAELMGSVYAVPGKGLSRSELSSNPVFSVSEGVDVYFLSIESLVDTCIEWVEQDDWDLYSTAPNERAIWKKHNPGILDF